MNKKFHGTICAGFFSLGLTASLNAAPITEQSLIQVRQLENTTFSIGTFLLNNFITTNSSVSHRLDTSSGFGSRVEGHANLATGQSGTFASTSTPEVSAASSVINIYDTLTFSTANGQATDVSYTLNFDGNLSNADATASVNGGFANAFTQVSIYDITGLNTWLDDRDTFETSSDGTTSPASLSISAPLVSRNDLDLAVGSQQFIDAYSLASPDQSIVDTSGTVFHFDLSETGTFTVDPTKTYGIHIASRSLAGGMDVTSDFLNTSAFSFTNLNGSSFTSGSGAFLSSGTVVSEPSVLALLGIGLLGFMRRNRNRQ